MTPKDAVATLLNSGLSEARIAELVQSSQPTIHRVRHGADCRFRLGEALVREARRVLSDAGCAASKVA